MYQVMIVDDEPSAVNLVRTIIEKRCENFAVSDTAYSGEEALEKMRRSVPDVLITDIRMTGLSGLDLIETVRDEFPDVVTVLVSGYQEFEYAKKAVHLGVLEYILKPIMPAELCRVMEHLKQTLREKYHRKRNQILHRLVNNLPVSGEDMACFPFQNYHGAIVRLNGLPVRFGERRHVEIFSDINDYVMTYGRDDQETLYMLPEGIFGDDCAEKMGRYIGREQPDAAYVTTIICRNPVPVAELGEMMRGLYRTLDSVSILGKSQTLIMDDCRVYETDLPDRNYEYLQELEYLARNQKYDRLKKETKRLILMWGEEERTQIWMEARIRQICYLLQRYDAGNTDYRECEFLLDEAFANMESMQQLAEDLCDILFKDKQDENVELQKQSTEDFFDSVKEYIKSHIAESLSLQQVSYAVGVSQPYLSKLFRKYEDTSFNSYLTAIRMEKAKQLLQRADRVLVKEVAEQVGYKDQFYFSRIFYSYTGMRPSEYIEKGENNDL